MVNDLPLHKCRSSAVTDTGGIARDLLLGGAFAVGLFPLLTDASDASCV